MNINSMFLNRYSMVPAIKFPRMSLLGLGIGFISVFASLHAHAEVLMDETFATGSPDHSTWYFTGGAANTDTSNPGSITYDTDVKSGFQDIVTYFTPQGSPASLSVGDTLAVNVNFSLVELPLTNSGDQSLRVGLYNSKGGSRPTSNYTDYTGFTAYLDTSRITDGAGGYRGPILPYRRIGGNSLLGNTGTAHTALSPREGSWENETQLQDSTAYELSMEITRTSSSELSISFSLTGGGLTDYNGIWTNIASEVNSVDYGSFDTFAIVAPGNDKFESITLDHVTVSLIPESQSNALWMSMCGVAMVLGLRLRKRRI